MTRSTGLLVLIQMLAVLDLAAAPVRRRPAREIVSRPAPRVVVTDDFRNGALGWNAGFADYSPVQEQVMELDAGIRPLPTELGNGTGYFITAHNRSDDVFMFLTKRLTAADGIRANQSYSITFRMLIGSNAGGDNCAGIGGHPGFSVFLKAGGSSQEPRSILVAAAPFSHYRMNVDKGNQSAGGPAASVAGNVSTGSANCFYDAPFLTIERLHQHTYPVTASAAGELWLLVATDSGFEGKSRLYYQAISASLEPVE